MTTSYDDPVIFNSSVVMQGALVLNGAFTPPSVSIANASIAVGAEISADKLKHRHSKTISQAIGTDVVDKTEYIHIARAAGALKSVKVRPITSPTGGDKQFTVDVKKVPDTIAVASGTTLLTAPLAISSADADNTNKAAALAASTYASGDMIVVLVDVTGSTGSQGQGVVIEVEMDESGV